MSVNQSELKPVASALLKRSRYLAKLGENDDLAVTFEKQDEDGAVIAAVLKQVIEQVITATQANHDFAESLSFCRVCAVVAPEIISGLLSAQVFKDTNSERVKVTAGHFGTTPFDHIQEVFRSLLLSQHMTAREIIEQVIVALLHDLGKGLAAEVENLEALMDEHEQSKHWHPDHALVSIMLVETLLKTPAMQQLQDHLAEKYAFSESNWEHVLVMIRHHHGFEGVSASDGMLIAQKGHEEDLELFLAMDFRLVMMLYYFAFADMSSTAAYHKFWEEKVAFFEAWLEEKEQTLVETRAGKIATDGLKLAPDLLREL